MIKKELTVLVILILSIFLISFASAVNSTTLNVTQLEKAYQCVQNKVGDDCSKLEASEQAAVLLSHGNYKDCREEFLKKSNNEQCWPSGNCKIKDTAIALLALNRAGANTDKISNWLLNQTKVASDLIWYIQIDSNEATLCDVSYNNLKYKLTINGDKTVSGSAGSCLIPSENNYWFKISQTCIEKDYAYTISCNKDFATTLLYRSSDSSTIHVSQNLHSEVAGGEAVEQVTYKCFKTGSACDYEGSLWAIVALNKKAIDTSKFLPYLDASIEQNNKYFPEAFLYIVTNLDSYLKVIVEDNFKGTFWKVGDYNKFYSTSLGFLALQSQNSDQVASAKEYLLNGRNQNADGCWNNVYDTGLLLYAGWPINTNGDLITDCELDADCRDSEVCLHNICVDKPGETDCENSGYFCISNSECDPPAIPFNSLSCSGVGEICCSQNVDLPTCVSKGGDICRTNEDCSTSDYVNTLEGQCCLGTCSEIILPTQNYTCRDNSGLCKNSCDDTTEEISDSLTCEGSKICCLTKSSAKSYWWIWVLLILIIIVVIAIIFRDKLRGLLFKFQGKFRKGPAPRETRPPFFPPSSGQTIGPRAYARPMFPIPRFSTPQRPQVVRSSKDKEFDETLKKLKDMSR